MSRIESLVIILFLFPTLLFAQIERIKTISPNGGEMLTPNKHYGISWVAEGVEKVRIYYSVDNKGNWILITDEVSADLGHFSWKTPNQKLLFENKN